MSKSLSSKQGFASVSTPEATSHDPRLEEIKRKLFPQLVVTKRPKPSHPRFTDLVNQFADRRPA